MGTDGRRSGSEGWGCWIGADVLAEVHVSAHVECGAALIAEGARAAGVKHVSFRPGGRQEGADAAVAETIADELEDVAQHAGVRAELA